MIRHYRCYQTHILNRNRLLLFVERAKTKFNSSIRRGQNLSTISRGSNDAGKNGFVRGNIPVGGVGIALTQYAEVRTKFRVEYKNIEIRNNRAFAVYCILYPLCSIRLTNSNIFFYSLYQVNRIFKPEEVHQFGDLIGDNNPIHRQNDVINFSEGSQQIVHGMLSASLFSSIFGTLIPGSLYRSQSILFQTPIYSNEEVVGLVTVRKIRHVKRRGVMVTCDTNVYKNCGASAKQIQSNMDAIVCITGEAVVWIPVW